ncbi:hypothetical protein E2562_013571 [Oryza meyeriana var. granulata]|uniref:Uncharacterized protein n=1 Tax=Oryza meyeriana var. granulata TaxID=110450 RepID=A0A6G1C602_9ORYZ|nr:hypothetical protein E2562_013571 [Oryza meyeriana var. granulata]
MEQTGCVAGLQRRDIAVWRHGQDTRLLAADAKLNPVATQKVFNAIGRKTLKDMSQRAENFRHSRAFVKRPHQIAKVFQEEHGLHPYQPHHIKHERDV